MRTAAVLTLAALALPVRAEASSPCGVRGAKVIARNAIVTVVQSRTRSWACTSRGRVPLGDRVDAVTLAGRFAAFRHRPRRSTGWRYVSVLDTRSSARLTSYGDAGGDLTLFRLSRTGRMAWIRKGATTLHVMDAGGEELYPRTTKVPALHRDRCSAGNTTTIARNAAARLFIRGRSVFGCDLANGGRTFVGAHAASLSFQELEGKPDLSFRLAGSFAAAVQQEFDDPHFPMRMQVELAVYNLRSGRRAHDWRCCGPDATAGIREFVLSPLGGVAWTYGGTVAPGFLKSDADGEQMPVDPGHEDEARALAVDGSTLRWLRGDEPMSTDLR